MPVPVVMTARRDNQVTLPKAGLPDDMRRDPGIGGVGQIAIAGAANEPPISRWIEPAHRFTVSDDWSRRRLRLADSAPPAPAMPTMTPSVSIVLEVAPILMTVEALPATVLLLVSVV